MTVPGPTNKDQKVITGSVPENLCWETCIRSLGWKDPLEKGMATHPSIPAFRIPWTEEPGRLQSTGVAKSRTRLSDLTFTLIERLFSSSSLSAISGVMCISEVVDVSSGNLDFSL